MPIYEYECSSCGKIFEKLVMGSSKNDISCPDCGGKETRKLFSSFAAFFNGQNIGSSGCSTCSSGNCSSCQR